MGREMAVFFKKPLQSILNQPNWIIYDKLDVTIAEVVLQLFSNTAGYGSQNHHTQLSSVANSTHSRKIKSVLLGTG